VQNVVERVLNLLIYLLESPAPVTADDIRHTVQGYGDQTDDAFHRMFERDKEVLRRLGVPIARQAIDVWEVDYGYTVDPDEYAVADPKLTEEERAALSLAARMVRLGGSHLGIDALLKLGGVERTGGLEPIGADLGPGTAALGDLFAAVTERRTVAFEYRGARRSLNPYGLTHQRGHWYVVGETPDGERVYRVDRMSGVTVSEQRDRFKKPRGFDVRRAVGAQPWEAGLDDQVVAEVRFDPDVAWWAARTLGLPEPDGELVAEIPVNNVDALIGWVLSFGEGAEVLSPPTMRQEIRARVEAALGALT
jgi:proteasome accessory factor B